MALVKCEEENIRAIIEAIRLNPNFTDTYKLEEIPDVIEDYIKDYQHFFDCFINNNRAQLENIQLPTNIAKIRDSAFSNCTNLVLTELPESLTEIGEYAFSSCSNLNSLTFKGTPQSIKSNAFQNCRNLKTINVPWSEGEVANAPWGATNATINYNYIN